MKEGIKRGMIEGTIGGIKKGAIEGMIEGMIEGTTEGTIRETIEEIKVGSPGGAETEKTKSERMTVDLGLGIGKDKGSLRKNAGAVVLDVVYDQLTNIVVSLSFQYHLKCY